MRVVNNTNNKILTEQLVIPTTLLDQSLGLLKYKTPTAILLRTRYGIHTFGMRYPIDVLILDRQKNVVALKKNIKPNRIFLWNIIYDTVLEFPEGTIKKTRTEIKNQLKFI